jgi:hypothetical protein
MGLGLGLLVKILEDINYRLPLALLVGVFVDFRDSLSN